MEQTDRKTLGIIVECAKMTPEIFEKALKDAVSNIGNHTPSGKITLNQLSKQGKIESIMVNENNIGGFSSIARKHNLTYALKRITADDGSRKYLIAFKGKDTEIMNKAFNEFLQEKTQTKETLLNKEKVQEIKHNISEKEKEDKSKERELHKGRKPQQIDIG